MVFLGIVAYMSVSVAVGVFIGSLIARSKTCSCNNCRNHRGEY